MALVSGFAIKDADVMGLSTKPQAGALLAMADFSR